MEIKSIITHHFVKSEDLNHHGTLFAGRTAEWFVEAGLIATAAYIPAENIVCLKIHGMSFTRPVQLGEIVEFTGRVVYTGKSRLVTNIRMAGSTSSDEVLNGFITFVNVDHEGHSFPHGVEIEARTPEEIALQEQAKELR
jgi:acyl-CoA hydrolase